MLDQKEIKDQAHLVNIIVKNLRKEIHPATKPSIDFIYKILEDAYNSGMPYYISNDMRQDIESFALDSTHHKDYCLEMVKKMKFQSKDYENNNTIEEERMSPDREAPIVFYDVEVFPNLFVLCWKYQGKDNEVVKMINPTAAQVSELFKYRLIGFNNRRYDNHIIYAKSMGYSNYGLYTLSQKIINDSGRGAFFGEAWNLSYADIYDFAKKKQSLKKWEIELGIHHQENSIPWDQDVPEERWNEVADYCCNDVIATEVVFDECKADFDARVILSELTGLPVNSTNRQLIIKMLLGNDTEADLQYTDLSKEFEGYEFVEKDGKRYNMYRGVDLGFGGYVYAEPGIYRNVALLDATNMHGASILALNKFGKHTKNFRDIRSARIAIKHKDYDALSKMYDGKFMKYVGSDEQEDNLQEALKLVLNTTYGIAAATFDNPLRDSRDVNNTIALRGALFMKTLQDEVAKKGFKIIFDLANESGEANIFTRFNVAHIKTDSIKIPNATPEIIEFVQEFGKKYGYEMEHECTYDRMCLVNDAVYIAKYDEQGVRNKGGKKAGKWTATGAEFQHPYIFKTLFSKEDLELKDYCEMKSVSKGEIYMQAEGQPDDISTYEFVGKVGSFIPVKEGHGGGKLWRIQNGKQYAVSGTKGYLWMEEEVFKTLGKDYEDIDISYFEKLCEDAIAHINEFGDFERFVNDENYDPRLEKLLSGNNDVPIELPFEEDEFMNKPMTA